VDLGDDAAPGTHEALQTPGCLGSQLNLNRDRASLGKVGAVGDRGVVVFAVELQALAVAPAGPGGPFDSRRVFVAGEVFGCFAFAFVEGVGGDRGLLRRLQRTGRVRLDFGTIQRPIVDPHLVDAPVEPLAEDRVAADPDLAVAVKGDRRFGVEELSVDVEAVVGAVVGEGDVGQVLRGSDSSPPATMPSVKSAVVV
jgi:hypothetical protein